MLEIWNMKEKQILRANGVFHTSAELCKNHALESAKQEETSDDFP